MAMRLCSPSYSIQAILVSLIEPVAPYYYDDPYYAAPYRPYYRYPGTTTATKYGTVSHLARFLTVGGPFFAVRNSADSACGR